MNEKELRIEIEKYYKKLPENPEIYDTTNFQTFPSQEKIKNDCVENIKKGVFYFFSVCGFFGSGKTFIAKQIGNEVKDKYRTFHYGLWQTDLELIHKHFLTELSNTCGNKKNNRIRLSINSSNLLDKAGCCIFLLIMIFLTFTTFNSILPLFYKIFCYFFTFEYILNNLNEITTLIQISSPIVAIIITTIITHFIYKRTGGTLYTITSIFGFGFTDTSGSISISNFYDIFKEIIKDKGIFIIIDNLDRVPKNCLEDALAFLDNVKSIVEKYNQEKSTNYVFVCVPIYKEKIIEFLEYNLKTKDKEEVREESKKVQNAFDFINSDNKEIEELYKKTDDANFFIDKLFEKEYFIENTREDVIKTFLKNMGVNQENLDKITPYFLICYNHNYRKINRTLNDNYYLIAFMDMSSKYDKNKEILICILDNSFLDYKLLKEQSVDKKNSINANTIALIYASEHGHLEIVKLLIEKGANVNESNLSGWTTLFFAINANHLDIANRLIEKGANLLVTNNDNYTTLMLCASKIDFNEITKKIIEIADLKHINIQSTLKKETALTVATKASNLEVAKLLIEKGADIYLKSSMHNNALIYSVQIDNIDIIKYFVEEKNVDITKEINININDEYALHYLIDYALIYGNKEIIEYLLSKGSTLKYNDGNTTSLMLVASSTNVEAVKYIIKYTEDEMKLDIKDYINYKDQNNQTALTYSDYNALNKNPKDRDKVVNLLKQYGAE